MKGLRDRVQELFPGEAIARLVPLGDDESSGEILKATGYGHPVRVELASGRKVVFHRLRADDFGHDRRADRIDNLVLAYDTFGTLPHHVAALDVGLIARDGGLISLADTGEPYLITSWAEGTLYADELRRIAAAQTASEQELAHAEQLARILLDIHGGAGSHPGAYTRAIRDLLGHGEGIFGLVDSYAPDTAAAPPERLRALEEACLAWRWRLRTRTERLRRTHGDCHPFNIVIGDERITLFDAGRGSAGDPADDVACLAINYLFFGAGHVGWAGGLGRLWDRFWSTYLADDPVDVLAAVAPFFAWRALVLASPLWYPHLTASDRDRILAFAERVLAVERFDPAMGAEVFQ